MQDEEALTLHMEEIKRVLRADARMKVEFGLAFTMTGSTATAQVWEHTTIEKRYGGTTNKWSKVGPFLTTKEGTRSSLLEFLAHLTKEN